MDKILQNAPCDIHIFTLNKVVNVMVYQPMVLKHFQNYLPLAFFFVLIYLLMAFFFVLNYLLMALFTLSETIVGIFLGDK